MQQVLSLAYALAGCTCSICCQQRFSAKIHTGDQQIAGGFVLKAPDKRHLAMQLMLLHHRLQNATFWAITADNEAHGQCTAEPGNDDSLQVDAFAVHEAIQGHNPA